MRLSFLHRKPRPTEIIEAAHRVVPASGRRGRESALTVPLTDQATVRAWLRELTPDQELQIFVDRSWGTVLAMADGNASVTLLFTDDDNRSFVAPAPVAAEVVEQVLLESMHSLRPPAWVDWREIA